MSIVVVGNCQVPTLAKIFSWILEDHDATCIPVHTLKSNGLADALDRVNAADLVVTQPIQADHFGPMKTQEIIQHRSVAVVPNLFFEGHLPDCCYVGGMGQRLRSPAGEYHSIIALKSFIEGRSVEETASLFNKTTFADFGYLDLVDKSWSELEGRAKVYDRDWSVLIAELQTLGCFSYTVNHPNLSALTVVAREALRQLGLHVNLS